MLWRLKCFLSINNRLSPSHVTIFIIVRHFEPCDAGCARTWLCAPAAPTAFALRFASCRLFRSISLKRLARIAGSSVLGPTTDSLDLVFDSARSLWCIIGASDASNRGVSYCMLCNSFFVAGEATSPQRAQVLHLS